MMKRQNYELANIFNCRAIFSQIWKQQKAEAEALNFGVLMDCLNQQNFKKVKASISLSVYERNILVIIDKIVSLRRNFSKAFQIVLG